MRELDVFISDKDRRGFIRRALRRFHKDGNEYIEGALVRVAVGQYHVEKLVKLKMTSGVGDDGHPFVQQDEAEWKAAKKAAEKNGLKFITIHSHPNCDSSPSKADHIGSVQDGEVLVGVLEIWKDSKTKRTKTSLDFWVPQLPCKVNVVKAK